jgi:hypothetical protein
MSIFAIAIAKIDIRIKKLTALPERPIKIFLKVFKAFSGQLLIFSWVQKSPL